LKTKPISTNNVDSIVSVVDMTVKVASMDNSIIDGLVSVLEAAV